MKKAFIFLVVLILSSGLIIAMSHMQAIRVLAACTTSTLDSACVQSKVQDLILHSPTKGAAALAQLTSLRRVNLVSGDFRVFSLTLHELGTTFFSSGIPFEKLTTVCPPLIKDGCVHGYVMECISHHSIDEGLTLCSSTNNLRLRLGCIHALGHSYLELTMTSLDQAASGFCAAHFKDTTEEYAACVGGLFHEYTKGGMGMMEHNDYYNRPASYHDLPCDDFSGSTYTLCYSATGSFRQYSQDSEPLSTTLQICNQAKTQDARDACAFSAYERIDIAHGFSVIP